MQTFFRYFGHYNFGQNNSGHRSEIWSEVFCSYCLQGIIKQNFCTGFALPIIENFRKTLLGWSRVAFLCLGGRPCYISWSTFSQTGKYLDIQNIVFSLQVGTKFCTELPTLNWISVPLLDVFKGWMQLVLKQVRLLLGYLFRLITSLFMLFCFSAHLLFIFDVNIAFILRLVCVHLYFI